MLSSGYTFVKFVLKVNSKDAGAMPVGFLLVFIVYLEFAHTIVIYVTAFSKKATPAKL